MADLKIPTGMQMMLKTMGVDPEKMLGDFKDGLDNFTKMAHDKGAQLDRVENMCAEILTILRAKENSDGQPDDHASA